MPDPYMTLSEPEVEILGELLGTLEQTYEHPDMNKLIADNLDTQLERDEFKRKLVIIHPLYAARLATPSPS